MWVMSASAANKVSVILVAMFLTSASSRLFRTGR
jgi:hypothetical protein